MIDYKKTIEDLRNADNLTADHKLLGICERAAAIEALQAELDKYHELCDVDEIPEVLEILMTV